MKKTAICIFLLVFLLLSLGTAGLEVTRINIRFALMVRDMAEHGLRLFPTMNGVEYGDYPSLWILLSRMTSLNGRFLNLWTLSLPSLLLGAYTVAVTYCSGEMRGKGGGIIAAVLLLAAPQFSDLMSGFGLDVPVMACGATMLYLLQTERNGRRLCIAFAALFCISFCVRGPMGAAVFSVACGGALLFGERRLLRLFIPAGIAAALVCIALWTGAVFYAGGEELWRWFLMCQIGSRFGGIAVFSNLGNAFFSYAPLTLLCLCAFLFRRDSGLRSAGLRFGGFIFVPMVLLSFSSSFHLRYLAVTLPAQALLTAEVWRGVPEKYRDMLSRLERLCGRTVSVAVLLVLCAAACFLMPVSEVPFTHIGAGVVLILLRNRILRGVLSGFRPLWSVAVFLILGLSPFLAAMENSAAFAGAVERESRGRVLLYEMGPDHDDLKLLWNFAEKRKRTVYLYDSAPELRGFYRRMYPFRLLEEFLPELKTDDAFVVRNREQELRHLLSALEKRGFAVKTRLDGKLGHRKYLALTVEERGK